MRKLNGITNSMDMSFRKLQKLVMGWEACYAAVYEVTKSQTWLSDYTEVDFFKTTVWFSYSVILFFWHSLLHDWHLCAVFLAREDCLKPWSLAKWSQIMWGFYKNAVLLYPVLWIPTAWAHYCSMRKCRQPPGRSCAKEIGKSICSLAWALSTKWSSRKWILHIPTKLLHQMLSPIDGEKTSSPQ